MCYDSMASRRRIVTHLQRQMIAKYIDHYTFAKTCFLMKYVIFFSSPFFQETIEMQDVRMSPILSLRNRQNFNFENEEATPSFRMQTSVPRPGYPIRGGHTQLLRRKTPQNQQKRKRVLTSLKRKAKEIRQRIPTVTDVNKIDKYSRLVFPLLFILFNACYWCFYLLQ